jgi:hypothetical protein
MININRFQVNTFVIPLQEDVTYENPFYIFEWEDIYNRKVCFSIPDESLYPESYNQFTYCDASISSIYLQASGTLRVYESLYDASTVDSSMNLLHTEAYKFIDYKPTDITFDPSIAYEDSVFDPSMFGTYPKNQDFVFDPVFADGGAATPYTVNADQIVTDSEHRFITDACIAYIATLPQVDFVVSADSSLYSYIDGSVNMLKQDIDENYNALDASITANNIWNIAQDLSINDIKNKNISQDASLVLLATKDNTIDASLVYLKDYNAQQDVSIIVLRNKDSNIDVSLNSLVAVNNSQDASIVVLRSIDSILDASIQSIKSVLDNIDHLWDQ